MNQSRSDAGGEIKFQESLFPDPVFHHSAEEEKYKHVENNVQGAEAVYEHVSYELPQKESVGDCSRDHAKYPRKIFVKFEVCTLRANDKKNDADKIDHKIDNDKLLDGAARSEAGTVIGA